MSNDITDILNTLNKVENPERVTRTSLREAMSKITEDQMEIIQLVELLEEAQQNLRTAVEQLSQAQRLARRSGETIIAAQINGYTIPWIEAFIDRENQVGNIASLIEMLQDPGLRQG